MKMLMVVKSTLKDFSLTISRDSLGYYWLNSWIETNSSHEVEFSLRDLEHLRDELTTLINAEKQDGKR